MSAVQERTEQLRGQGKGRKGPLPTTPGTEATGPQACQQGDASTDEALEMLPLSRSRQEVHEMIAWGQERHDVEMRIRALAIELDRVMARLQTLLERYDALQAERTSADPHLRQCDAMPSTLGATVMLARKRLHNRWIDPPAVVQRPEGVANR